MESKIWDAADLILQEAFDKIQELMPGVQICFIAYNKIEHYVGGNACPLCAGIVLVKMIEEQGIEHKVTTH